MTSNARDVGVYTSRQLQERLSKIRGRSVPYDTLKRWRHSIGLTPDYSRLYSENDLEILKSLVLCLKKGGNTPQFVSLLKRNQQHHGT